MNLHAGVGLLLGKVAGQAEVRDTNMTMFIQQDISWLREDIHIGRVMERVMENVRDNTIKHRIQCWRAN